MSHKASYLSAVSLQQQLPVFFQPWWLDIVSADWDMLFGMEEEKVRAVFPVCREYKFGLKLLRNPLLTPYLGPFFLGSGRLPEAALLHDMWQQMPRWDSFDMEAMPGFNDTALFGSMGFETRFKDTYMIDLAPDREQLFSKISSNHRNLIRQATPLHQVSNALQHLPVLLELHKATFTRKKKPYPFDPEIIRKLVETGTARNSGHLFAALDASGQVTASIFTVNDARTMYLLLSTFHTERAHPGAVRMLIWEAIRKAKALGLSSFDFEGSMDPGIAAFFRRFGAERKTYLCVSKTTSPIWKLKKKLLG